MPLLQDFLVKMSSHHYIDFQVKIRPKIPEQDNDNLPDQVNAELSWKHHRMLHESIIVELFQVIF